MWIVSIRCTLQSFVAVSVTVPINLETSASGGHSEDKTLNRNVNARLEIRYRNYVARRQIIKSLRTPLREMRT